MNKTAAMMDFVRKSGTPVTSKEIATALGLNITSVAATLLNMVNKGNAYGLARKLIATSASNTPIYGYWIGEDKTPDLHAQTTRSVKKSATKAHKDTAMSIDGFVEGLAHALVSQVVARVKVELEAQLKALVPPAPVHHAIAAPETHPVGEIHPPVPATKREVKAKVAITGLLPQHAGMISSEFGDVFDLRFPDCDNPGACKSAALHCDKVFAMTKFIGHRTEDNLQSAGANLVRVRGGMSDLRDALTRLFVGE